MYSKLYVAEKCGITRKCTKDDDTQKQGDAGGEGYEMILVGYIFI